MGCSKKSGIAGQWPRVGTYLRRSMDHLRPWNTQGLGKGWLPPPAPTQRNCRQFPRADLPPLLGERQSLPRTRSVGEGLPVESAPHRSRASARRHPPHPNPLSLLTPCMFRLPWIDHGHSERAGTDRSLLGRVRPRKSRVVPALTLAQSPNSCQGRGASPDRARWGVEGRGAGTSTRRGGCRRGRSAVAGRVGGGE